MNGSATCPACHREMDMADLEFLVSTVSEKDLADVATITALAETLGMRDAERLPEILDRANLVIGVLRERIRVLEGRDA